MGHCRPQGHGSPRVHRTKEFLARRFWWPGMDKDVREFVLSCSVCARNKNPPSCTIWAVTSTTRS
uniref:Integrase zinc-binding domain-containing protein n=1 Tax=Anguilla anguilla TaxID=7936 RepID=A0A0E9RQR1_ANGAN